MNEDNVNVSHQDHQQQEEVVEEAKQQTVVNGNTDNTEESGDEVTEQTIENNDNDCKDDADPKSNESNNDNNNNNSYVGRKPRWWKTLARRKGTKHQRNAIQVMTQKGYVIPKLSKYQHMIDVNELIQTLPRGVALTDELFFPREGISTTTGVDSGDSDNNISTDNTNAANNQPDVVTNKNNNINDQEETIVHLEIGFGQGENLLTNAMCNPNEFYIGAEIHQPGVGVALSRMKSGVENGNFWEEQDWFRQSDNVNQDESGDSNEPSQEDTTTITPSLPLLPSLPYDNLRIYPGDGVKILRYLPNSSIHNIYLTFPDPWPKNQQSQFRVIQEDTVDVIGNVLKPGGCFYLATDSIIFDEWTKKVFDIVNEKRMEADGVQCWQKVEDCPDRKSWLPVLSKYESKGIEEGRSTACTCWRYIGP
jgi:tRNA G46 methylase TrmB